MMHRPKRTQTFTVDVKINQPWQLRKKFVTPNRWVRVAVETTRKAAEMSQSWIDLDVADGTHYLKNFKIEYRIQADGSTIWEKKA